MMDPPNVFALVAASLQSAGVEGLLIGGFAVNHYGYSRNTLDIDFMISADRLAPLRQAMIRAGFTNVSIQDHVAFFARPGLPLRVDFLLVDAATMRSLSANTQTITLQGQVLRVPALLDLLAMKLFALAQAPARRMDKDLPDIAWLCVLNRLDLERDIHPLCQRFATEEIWRLVTEKVASLQS